MEKLKVTEAGEAKSSNVTEFIVVPLHKGLKSSVQVLKRVLQPFSSNSKQNLLIYSIDPGCSSRIRGGNPTETRA